jgi:hypothetical protein
MPSIKFQPHDFIRLPTKGDAEKEGWQWPTTADAKDIVIDILKVSKILMCLCQWLTEAETRCAKQHSLAGDHSDE